jgi:hypothetical protein
MANESGARPARAATSTRIEAGLMAVVQARRRPPEAIPAGIVADARCSTLRAQKIGIQ